MKIIKCDGDCGREKPEKIKSADKWFKLQVHRTGADVEFYDLCPMCYLTAMKAIGVKR